MATGTVIVSGSTDQYVVGVPPNNPGFYDGTRYWIFYNESQILKCQYGTSLDSMSEATLSTTVSIPGSEGRGYSMLFGQASSSWHAWCHLYGGGTAESLIKRWSLESTGLANELTHSNDLGSKNGNPRIAHDYGGVSVSAVFVCVEQANQNRANRQNLADLSSDTGTGGQNFIVADTITQTMSTTIGFWETGRFIKLSNGILTMGFSSGGSGSGDGTPNSGIAWEIATTGASFPLQFTTNITGGAGGAGTFVDASYAANTSHMGQSDDCQLDDGTYWIAYIDDADETNGDYGHIILRNRGHSVTSSWSTVSTDIIGSSAEAWHLAVSTDGTDVWIFYVKDSSGSRDSAIYYKKYDVAGTSLGSETKLADIQTSHTFSRMATQWRAANNKIIVVWSEDNGDSTYDMLASEVSLAQPKPAGIKTRFGTYSVPWQPVADFSGKTAAVSVTTTPSSQVFVLMPENPGYRHASIMQYLTKTITSTLTITLHGKTKI